MRARVWMLAAAGVGLLAVVVFTSGATDDATTTNPSAELARRVSVLERRLDALPREQMELRGRLLALERRVRELDTAPPGPAGGNDVEVGALSRQVDRLAQQQADMLRTLSTLISDMRRGASPTADINGLDRRLDRLERSLDDVRRDVQTLQRAR